MLKPCLLADSRVNQRDFQHEKVYQQLRPAFQRSLGYWIFLYGKNRRCKDEKCRMETPDSMEMYFQWISQL